jgi:hypothetical protein
MDAAGLRSRIQGTLSPDADIRRQAEQELKAVRHAHMLLASHEDMD